MYYAMLNKNTSPDTALLRSEVCDYLQKTKKTSFKNTIKKPSSSYLIVVVMTVKEGFLSEDHAGEHATQTPHVQAVVIHLQTTQRDEKV